MSRHVRIYIEGGAAGKAADSDFRRGWKKFLNELHELARVNDYHSLEVVRGRGRVNTFDSFKAHRRNYPNDLCVLLVDAETAVPEGASVWDVVMCREGDGWQRPSWATERHLYLMVHFVEAWLIADQEALRKFYKQGFNPRSIPTTNLEARPKNDIERALRRATQGSLRGSYRHGHAHEVIEIVSPDKVKTLKHGRRLFSSLGSLIKNEPET